MSLDLFFELMEDVDVAGVAPANTVPPFVVGQPFVGLDINCSPGTWSGTPSPSIGIQWMTSPNGTTGFTPLAGFTGTDYVTQASDVGNWIAPKVTATNASGSADNSASLHSVAIGPIAQPGSVPDVTTPGTITDLD